MGLHSKRLRLLSYLDKLNEQQIRWGAAALTAVPLLIGLWMAGRVVQFGGMQLFPQFESRVDRGAIEVTRIYRPLNGDVLQKGDRIVAIEGVPVWRGFDLDIMARRTLPNGYRATLERQGNRLEVFIKVGRFPALPVWFHIVSLLPSLCFLSIGLLLIWLRPDLTLARLAFATCFLTGWYNLALAVVSLAAAELARWERLLFDIGSLIYPWHLLVAYFFFSNFPTERPESFYLRSARYLIFGLSVLSAICSGYMLFLASWGPLDWVPSTFAVVSSRAAGMLQRLADPSIFATFLFLIVRNYRAEESRDGRRRLQWVVGATAVAVSAQLAWSFQIVGWEPSGIFFSGKNLLAAVSLHSSVLIPLSVLYTVVRYRVVGISVFLRLGMQYALARNVLRLLPIIPVALLGLVLWQNPNATLREFFLRGEVQANLGFLVAGFLLYRNSAGIERRLDQKFFRESYERDRILEHLLQSVKAASSQEQLTSLLRDEIERAFHPEILLVYVQQSEAGSFALSSSHGEIRPEWRSTVEQRLSSEEMGAEVQELKSSTGEGGRALLVPIRSVNANALGALVLGEKRSEEPYTKADRAALVAIAQQVGLILETFRLMEEVKKHERVQQEVVVPLLRDQMGIMMECPRCGRCFDAEEVRCGECGSQLAHLTPVPRTLLGRYRLDRVLGKGGMGAVFRAQDLRLHRDAALKIILGRHMGDATMQRRFAREAAVLARLEHKNIVRIYDYGDLKREGAFLVMELLEGTTLRGAIGKLKGKPEAALPVLQGIARGLEYAHSRGVIHRDFKPENCILCVGRGDGTVAPKILDFGLAKLQEAQLEEARTVTAAGAAMGTWGYMPPEQMSSATVDARADQFAFGVVCLETLTGSLSREERIAVAALPGILQRRFAMLPESWQGLQEPLLRATAFRREDRYSGVAEFADDFLSKLTRAETVGLDGETEERSGEATGSM